MSVEKIIGDWKKGKFKPVYLFHGEEGYFIDQLIHFAENNIIKADVEPEPITSITCDKCGGSVLSHKLKSHQETMKCRLEMLNKQINTMKENIKSD